MRTHPPLSPEHLKRAILAARTNAAQLSAKTGIPKPRISDYVLGKSNPNTDKLQRIAHALGCAPGYLQGLEDPPEDAASPPCGTMTTRMAARCMGLSEGLVKADILRNKVPWGHVVPMDGGGRRFYVVTTQFRQYIGAAYFDRFFGLTEHEGRELYG